MECREVEIIIAAWEKGDSITQVRLEELEKHMMLCPQCGKLSPLISLLKRDLPSFRKGDIKQNGFDVDLSDLVMARLEGKKKGKIILSFPRIAAVAAVLIAVLFLGIYFGPQESDYLVVRFEIQAPSASSVSLIGDFTDWNENALILGDTDGDGIWEAKIRLKKGNIYKYNFVVDEELWITDPASHLEIDDGFGGKNSLIQI